MYESVLVLSDERWLYLALYWWSGTFKFLHRYMYTMKDPLYQHHFDTAWGSNWGSLGFYGNQNNHGSSGVYVTCIYCSLSMKMKINMYKTRPGGQRSWAHSCVCFGVCGQWNPDDSQYELRNWRYQYMGQHTRSWVSGINLWINSCHQYANCRS